MFPVPGPAAANPLEPRRNRVPPKCARPTPRNSRRTLNPSRASLAAATAPAADAARMERASPLGAAISFKACESASGGRSPLLTPPKVLIACSFPGSLILGFGGGYVEFDALPCR